MTIIPTLHFFIHTVIVRYLHESVPAEYRDIIAYHELEESEMMYVDGVETHQAHQQAVAKTTEYARSHLSKEDFEKFLEWQKTLDNY